MANNNSPAIGIDLGTTFSCVAVYEYGTVEIIADEQGSRTTPSYVAFTEAGRLVGETAKSQVAMNVENTIFDAKRLIGRRFNDETVQADMKHFPFTVVDVGGKPNVEVEYNGEVKRLCPEEISSIILVRMKEIAEAYLGTEVKDAVITVPAYFNNAQRQATKNAGEIAGLNVLRIINEPTAAAIAYGLEKRSKGEKNILVFDLGGGTFDVSILTIDDGVFEVKATSGDSHLGGEDFDGRMVDYFVQEFKRKSGHDIVNDKKALRRLRTACEMAKRTLSSSTHTSINVQSLFDGVNFNSNITRAKFEDLCSDLFLSTVDTVEKALLDAQMEKKAIDEIILVGGSTRIPKIQKLLQEFFEGKELNCTINPDEAVAYGAAVQAAILTGVEAEVLNDLLLLDVIPLSLGIENADGLMAKVIERNSATPTRETRYAAPNYTNQTNVFISVYEGESPIAKQNNLLGEFQLTGIRAAAGNDLPIIEITYEIDADGILNVSAEDVETKQKNHITINNDASRLSQLEIDRMRREAELFRQQNETEAKRLEARGALDRYIDYVRSTSEQGSFQARISAGEQQTIAQKVQEMTVWFEDNPRALKEDIDAKRSELKDVCQPIIERAYRNI